MLAAFTGKLRLREMKSPALSYSVRSQKYISGHCFFPWFCILGTGQDRLLQDPNPAYQPGTGGTWSLEPVSGAELCCGDWRNGKVLEL